MHACALVLTVLRSVYLRILARVELELGDHAALHYRGFGRLVSHRKNLKLWVDILGLLPQQTMVPTQQCVYVVRSNMHASGACCSFGASTFRGSGQSSSENSKCSAAEFWPRQAI